jgi:protein-export membrane protein SecD
LLIELCTVTRGDLVEFDLSDANDGSYAITLDPIFVRDFRRKAIGPMVEVLKRRLDTFASAPAHVEVDRSGKVVVDVSGFVDRAALIQMFHPPTQLEFHAVDESVTASDIAAGHVPPQDLVLENDFDGPARNPVAISRAVLLSGSHIAEVTNGFSAGTDQPMVALVFDEGGTKLLAEFTRKYVGRRMAVVLDDKLITAPLIREAILGGRVEISGDFTNGDAVKLATLLSPGGAPLPLKLESVELH